MLTPSRSKLIQQYIDLLAPHVIDCPPTQVIYEIGAMTDEEILEHLRAWENPHD